MEKARRFNFEAIVAGAIILGAGLMVMTIALEKALHYHPRSFWNFFFYFAWPSIPICIFGALLLSFGLWKHHRMR